MSTPDRIQSLLTRKFYLRRVGLNSGGYDRMGCYWGVDLPLYECCDYDGTSLMHFRAVSREAAKVKASQWIARQFGVLKPEFYQ